MGVPPEPLQREISKRYTALHSVKRDLLIQTTQLREQKGHLAVVGDGLLILVNYVFGAKAVLRTSNFSAGVRIYAIGGEGTCKPTGRKEIIFCFFRLVSLLL